MPLELNAEEIDSLRGNSQAEGSAVRKLLMHYNGDNGNGEAGIKVLPEVNSKQALEYQLRRVGGGKSLLILNVNALDKNFDRGTNHYVGLVVEPTMPSATVTYIDPLGEKINPEIKNFINETIAGGADITEYRGELQYAEIEGEGSARYFADGYNDYDCGPMLVYLMTKAAHNQELPALPDVEDEAETSKDIGRRLRRKFRNDNHKELGASTDLVNLSLADLRVVPRVAEVAEEASASVKESVESAKEADWVLRDDLSPLLVRKSYNPDLVSRRLDSIARLITGGDTCAAVAFDGQNILYSNNSGKQNDISKRVFGLLSEIAQSGLTLETISENKQLNQEMNAIAKIAAVQIVDSKRSRGNPSKKTELKKELENRLLKDIKKVAASLATDSDPGKKFPDELVDAFKNPKRFEFVPGLSKSGVVHAEMAILDKVVRRDGIEVPDRDVNEGRKPFYIGLTMLCCKDCRNAVIAYNEVSAEESKTRVADVSLFQTVGVRGQHLQQYAGWVSPDFFEKHPAVAEKYQEINGRGQKYNTGLVFADNSESEPEIDVLRSSNPAKTPAMASSSSSSSKTGVKNKLKLDAESANVDPRDIGRFSATTSANVRQQTKKRKI